MDNKLFEVDNSAPDLKKLYNDGVFSPTLVYKEIIIFPKTKTQPEMAAFDAQMDNMIKFCKEAQWHCRHYTKLFEKRELIWFTENMKTVKRSKKYSKTTKIKPVEIFAKFHKILQECIDGVNHHHKMPKGIIDRYNRVLQEGLTRIDPNNDLIFDRVKIKHTRSKPQVQQDNIIIRSEQ